MSRYHCATLIGVACIAVSVSEAGAQAAAPALSREDAVRRALGADPSVRAADAELRAAEAGLRQAARFVDPSLEILQENFQGTGAYSGQNRAETTYSLRQPLELGGDRRARRAYAARGVDSARLSGDIRKLDLILDVELAYIDVQAAEASLAIAEERYAVAEELAGAVDRRVRAARDPLMAGSRAQARLADAALELESARRAVELARATLSSYWNSGDDFIADQDAFVALAPETRLADGKPEVALADAQAAQARAQIDLERARAFPNVELHGGWRSFNEAKESAFLVGVTVPLPIWNGNRSAVVQAREKAAQAGFERDSRVRAAERQLSLLRSQADIARRESATLEANVIPNSQRALDQARQGYGQGAFSYLDVLEAQRAVTDARMRRVTALRNFHRAQVSIARLTGARAEEFFQ